MIKKGFGEELDNVEGLLTQAVEALQLKMLHADDSTDWTPLVNAANEATQSFNKSVKTIRASVARQH